MLCHHIEVYWASVFAYSLPSTLFLFWKLKIVLLLCNLFALITKILFSFLNCVVLSQFIFDSLPGFFSLPISFLFLTCWFDTWLVFLHISLGLEETQVNLILLFACRGTLIPVRVLEPVVCFPLFDFDATFYYIIYRWSEKSLISINFVFLWMKPGKSMVLKYMLVVSWPVI